MYGIPRTPSNNEDFQHIFLEAVGKTMPDLIFIQMDPMPYIVRQRFMAHKCAMNEVEDYDLRAVKNLNFPAPYTW